MHIAIVFNPISGIRAGHRALSDVVAALASHNHTLHVIDCSKQRDFEREIRQRAADLDRVIVIGGDGTLSSTINSVLTSNDPSVPIAFVPTGRGKDTARTLSSWSASCMANGAFEQAVALPTDVTRLKLHNGVERFSINISSIGLAAHAAGVANRLPRSFGSLSYLIGAVRAFVPLRPFPVTMTVDGEDVSVENALLVAACNGKSFGGGHYLAPDASQTDGQLDIVVVSNANLADLALQLGKLKTGKLREHPALTHWQATSVRIPLLDIRYFEADGESLSAQPVHYEVVPDAINWIPS